MLIDSTEDIPNEGAIMVNRKIAVLAALLGASLLISGCNPNGPDPEIPDASGAASASGAAAVLSADQEAQAREDVAVAYGSFITAIIPVRMEQISAVVEPLTSAEERPEESVLAATTDQLRDLAPDAWKFVNTDALTTVDEKGIFYMQSAYLGASMESFSEHKAIASVDPSQVVLLDGETATVPWSAVSFDTYDERFDLSIIVPDSRDVTFSNSTGEWLLQPNTY